MHAMVEAGADVIELGVPFSDPMADGPVVQRASERALAQHVGLIDVLAVGRGDFRGANDVTPIVLMGYANPIEAMGAQAFAEAAQAAGVDGVLVVDYPPEEAEAFAVLMTSHGHRPDLPGRANYARVAHAAGRPACAGLRLLRVAQGRDRCGASRYDRRGRASWPRSVAISPCRWAWASAFATRRVRRPSRPTRTRW